MSMLEPLLGLLSAIVTGNSMPKYMSITLDEEAYMRMQAELQQHLRNNLSIGAIVTLHDEHSLTFTFPLGSVNVRKLP